MLDETLLDSPDALARADTGALLRGTAEAGAHVRTALRRAAESRLGALRPDGRPRAVFVAGPGPAIACAADLLAALCDGTVPVTPLRSSGALAAPGALRWTLPGWAGSLDLLLVATPDGTEAGLTALIEQAYRRGCTVVTLCPADAPLAELTGKTHGLAVPLAAEHIVPAVLPPSVPRPSVARPGETPVPHAQPVEPRTMTAAPGRIWALLTPLLLLFDRLGLLSADEETLTALADRLDGVAERCGPAVETYGNPAKSLAAELAGTFPLLWSEGPVAGAVARHGARVLTAMQGLPALAGALPEAMAEHGALLAGELAAADPDDFFRDRVAEPAPAHARVVLLRDQAPEPVADAAPAVVAARELAEAQDTPVSELEASGGPLERGPLETAAELIATVDFAAVYLALAGARASSP